MGYRGNISLNKPSHLWLAAVTALVAVQVVAAFLLPHSFALSTLSDLLQTLLLISGAAACALSAVRAQGRTRLFWALMALGIGFWVAYQLFWTYTEVLLHQDVPDFCTWDVILFLHFVPLMAALALRPHVAREERSARVGRLDFALLLIWWMYLYVLIVMPWQYIVPNVAVYNNNLDHLYNAEKFVFLAALVVSWIAGNRSWRKLYGWLFLMSFCYSATSTLANWAIARRAYYSGSLYDIPFVTAMASITWIALSSHVEEPASELREASSIYGVWVARSSMIAVFSLPMFAAWTMLDANVPSKIQTFRLVLTFLAALLMGAMVFARQQLLDRELIRLLEHSRSSFDNLKRLQAQILQSEKIASIGQLVGGAAHELNNPITAMLGYSDLLLNTNLSPEQRPIAAKIGQYVRRTKSLVASLISFARQAPAPKTLVDLNTLVRTALKLSEPQCDALDLQVRTELDPASPKVLGDSNQLLQVCLQLVGNCLHLLTERGGAAMMIITQKNDKVCAFEIATDGVPAANLPGLDSDTGLALSACQGILQEHQGRILRQARENGAVVLRVELPASQAAGSKTRGATVPVMWQSQPYA